MFTILVEKRKEKGGREEGRKERRRERGIHFFLFIIKNCISNK
jgi:hypothetical protein